MKMKRTILAGVTAIVVMSLSVTSCKKKDTSTNEETQTAIDNANAEHTVNDVTAMSAQASDGSSSMTTFRTTPGYDQILSGSCASYTVDTILHTIVITFNGSLCLDGRTRSGSLTLNYSGSTNGARHYRDPGFSCTVTSNNYVVDGNQMNIINKTITNTTAVGVNPASTNLSWNVNAHVQIIKAGNGGTIDWNSSRTKYLINTSDTSVYHGASRAISWGRARVGIVGSANGTAANGETFTATVLSELIRDFTCRIGGKSPIIQGVLQFNIGTHPTRTIDFGNGTCDLTATVTVNNVTHTITLN
jgi:hypothetical protein